MTLRQRIKIKLAESIDALVLPTALSLDDKIQALEGAVSRLYAKRPPKVDPATLPELKGDEYGAKFREAMLARWGAKATERSNREETTDNESFARTCRCQYDAEVDAKRAKESEAIERRKAADSPQEPR